MSCFGLVFGLSNDCTAEKPKTLHGGAPDSVPLAAAVAPSVSYGCCSFPTCRGALPWATPDLFGPKSHLAAKKSMTHTFSNGKVPEN